MLGFAVLENVPVQAVSILFKSLHGVSHSSELLQSRAVHADVERIVLGPILKNDQSYTSSEECYADGAKRAGGRVIIALKEGKSKSEQMSIRDQI
jgi:hypothetical protein